MSHPSLTFDVHHHESALICLILTYVSHYVSQSNLVLAHLICNSDPDLMYLSMLISLSLCLTQRHLP